jgi:hypothetical protein
MTTKEKLLWPYSIGAALLAAFVIWVVMLSLLIFLESFLGWREVKSGNVLLAVLTGGSLPLALCLVDRFIGSRAVFDIKGVKIDFSQAQFERVSIDIPENIGRPEPVIADSSPMQIISALETATGHQIVRLDLRDGNAWWVTRLLALSAGAAHAGSPKAIVFVGAQEAVEDSYLGWGSPSGLLSALVKDPRGRGPSSVTYGQVYQKAVWLARELSLAAVPDIPAPPAPLYGSPPNQPAVTPEVQRYLSNPEYSKRGENALGQIVMDLCAQYSLETPPDRLTLGRLNEQFGHCLCRANIDLDKDQEKQIEALLSVDAAYIGLVRNGRYEGLLERAAVERHVIRSLLKVGRQ